MSDKRYSILGIEPEFQYEVSQIIRLFLSADDFTFGGNGGTQLDFQVQYHGDDLTTILTVVSDAETLWRETETLYLHREEERLSRETRRSLLRHTWDYFSKVTGQVPAWGILTGVRPTKVAFELLEKELGYDEAIAVLQNKYRMHREKAELIFKVAQRETQWIMPSDPSKLSLYYAIPYCPSRCVYCSFTAYTGAAKLKLLPQYVESMIGESQKTAASLTSRKVDTVYIGGGTPTMFSASQLDQLLTHIHQAYDVSQCREWTVEAGRPDTITEEKLQVLKKHGVTRICLNPQSFSEETLKRIGRSHTAEDIFRTVETIRNMGFHTMNMDLILGLPGETPEDVSRTMAQIAKIRPENLTVHTLALKRGSELRKSHEDLVHGESFLKEMLQITAAGAAEIGLVPYYLYRQKFMVESLENVGYSLPGHECVYNMQMMEEAQDILSFGAGGVSKICFPEENRHERVPNVKGLEEYLSRWEEMSDRKIALLREKSLI